MILKRKVEQLAIPYELRESNQELSDKDILIAKLIYLHEKLLTMPLDEFKESTGLSDQSEENCERIVDQILQVIKEAKKSIEKDIDSKDFGKKMSKFRQKLDDY